MSTTTRFAVPLAATFACALFVVAGAHADDRRASPWSLAAPPQGAVLKSTHDPYGSDDCSACHASADKNAPGPVADTSSALCLTCHDDPAPDATHRHGGAQGRCVDCHNPHASTTEKLLHAPLPSLCSGCHTNVAPRSARAHAPIAKPESCAACHAPHGSTSQRILTAPLAPTFYAPYRRDAYALCFSCHDAALVEAAKTTTATSFRDGDRNLHAVHVNRADGKGRTCRACHDAHAASGPALVPDSVAFGSHGWRMPLSFRATSTGGSCAKSCHLERSYARGAASAEHVQRQGE